MKITISSGQTVHEIEVRAVTLSYTTPLAIPCCLRSPRRRRETEMTKKIRRMARSLPTITLPWLSGSFEADVTYIDPFVFALPHGDPRQN